jgi:ssDNA-binding Zn-finger/Zn-ribbon topoisomerase 1
MNKENNEYTSEEIEQMHEAAKHENFDIEIKMREQRFDSNDVYYYKKGTKNHIGYGFIGKFENPINKIALVRCPACRKENYAMNVSSGICTWCPFDANHSGNDL